MWWEQVTTQPTYSGSLTAGGSHPAQLEEAGAPKSAALALLRAWKMLAIEMGKHGKNKHEGSPSCWKKRPFFCTVSFKNVRLG